MDEPECHLHPEALIKFLKITQNNKFYSQLWIATHSLFVIPEFNFANIVYLEDSHVISRNSKIYEVMLNKMIGENYKLTSQFFVDLEQWQYFNYIMECFTNPSVIDAVNPNDEQVQLFIKFIEEHRILSVLDYGGGSARLGKSLKISNYKGKNDIQYDIYDKNLDDEFIETLRFNDISAYKSIPSKKYDCVVLMNVLHEIDPCEWGEVFSNIYALLADESYILFVEKSILTEGEMPNNTGYTVLGNEELQVLFNSSQVFPELKIKSNQKSICAIIQRHFIESISTKTIASTIEKLEEDSFQSLKKERENLILTSKINSKTYSNNYVYSGRKYAFYLQQYINARLFNDSCKTKDLFHQSFLKNKDITISGRTFSRITLATRLLFWSREFILYDQKHKNVYVKIQHVLKKFIDGFVIDNESVQYLWNTSIRLDVSDKKYIISLCLLTLCVTDAVGIWSRLWNDDYLEYLPFDITKEIHPMR